MLDHFSLLNPVCRQRSRTVGTAKSLSHQNSQPSTQNFQLIHAYTRSQAVADGFQIEVTKVAREAGITFPVFLTRSVYDSYVTVPPGVTAQDEAGRLWDIVWMLRFAIRQAKPGGPHGSCRLPVALYVRNDNRRARSACPLRFRSSKLRFSCPASFSSFFASARDFSISGQKPAICCSSSLFAARGDPGKTMPPTVRTLALFESAGAPCH